MSELCCICLDEFTRPASLPCGHIFCLACVGEYWRISGSCQCPLCKACFPTRPQLQTHPPTQSQVGAAPLKAGEVPCDLCPGRRPAVKSCLVCLASYCDAHLELHYQSEALGRHLLIGVVKNLEDPVCRVHGKPLDRFCRSDRTCVCAMCSQTEHRGHHIVPVHREAARQKVQLKRMRLKLQQVIQERLSRVENLQNHASTQRLKGHKLVAPVKNLDDRACLKHGRPLELYSKKQQRCICVRCLEGGPEQVVSTEDEWEKKKVELENAKTELEAKIQKRETQLDELSKSVKSCQDLLENEWLDIEAVFAAVLSIVEEARARALQPLEDRRQVVENEAENIQQDLEAEISRLETTISELEEISTLEDHIHFLQNYPSLQNLDDIKDWAEVQLDTSLSFGTMRKTTAIMKEKVQQELEKLTSIELRRIPKFTVDVKLDPATAHQCLVLSEDGKEVKDGEEDPEVDDAPERFDMFGSVLGLQGFTSGRSYWEVEVGNKPGWDLGVARGDANRKGKLSLNPDSGYWATVHYEDDQYAALTAPPLLLSLLLKPEKVGVFVDYEEDLVSFYNVTARSHIYSFTGCSFSGGELYPYFSPHRKQDDESGDPLIISSVKQREQIMDES